MEVPGNNALPITNSPSMHPIDHISTAFVYLVDPNNISGALYHLVATYSVMKGFSPPSSLYATDLAKPKSATLTKHSESNNTLDGLRSYFLTLKNYPMN